MSDILRIATSGLLASQKSLDTISNNISNANIPEYNRQVTTVASLPSIQVGKLYYGSGVDVAGTQRIVNQYIVEAQRNQATNVGQQDITNQILSEIDKLFSDPSLGITDGLNLFFDSLQEMNNDPSSIPARSIFLSQAGILVNRFNEIYQQVDKNYSLINSEIAESVAMINKISTQLADINLKIQSLGGITFGSAPNDLLDLREKLLLDLSEYTGISINRNQDDTIDVFIGNGQTLVIGKQTSVLTTGPSPTDAYQLDIFITQNGINHDINTAFSSGKVAGLMEVRDGVLPGILNAMGGIAITISETFNQIHQQGLDLYGELGGKMFNDFNEYAAKVDRVQASSHNLGTAIFSATINSIAIGDQSPQIISNPIPRQNAGSLTPITSSVLSINGVTIRTTTATDDTVSTTDSLASAIAIAKAINSQSSMHQTQAVVGKTVSNLGQFTTGALAAGNLSINGVQVISTGVDASTLVQDINNLQFQTGVVAYQDSDNNIVLSAADGRNIQLTKTANSAGATFSFFDVSAGPNMDVVNRASITLNGAMNGTIAIGGISPSNIGFTAQTVPQQYDSLTLNDYELSYDGTMYTLKRLPDLSLAAQSSTPLFTLDGFTLRLETGTMSAGDIFLVQPTRTGAKNISFIIEDVARIALASPIKVQALENNKGTGSIKVTKVMDTNGLPIATAHVLGNAFENSDQITPPLRIQFTSGSSYIVLNMSAGEPGIQVGPEQRYDSSKISSAVFPITEVLNNTPPGPNANYTYDPGYRISLSGMIQAGDTFDIGYNDNASGDNRNGLMMASLQFEKAMNDDTSTFQETYTKLIGNIGSQALQSKISFESGTSLMKSIETRRNQVSGVNLDEEAADLLRFEQAYQACAQVIFIAKGIFDSLLRAVGA